uniref:Uncharacterized protein n=1 Tax=Pyxicephalus adspersus TaxID=30357 RepID=A0AAV3AMN2_PYXAD|nr:TPA: hypothetical protein GDO54_012773 [Pyxicephalus adspersus]
MDNFDICMVTYALGGILLLSLGASADSLLSYKKTKSYTTGTPDKVVKLDFYVSKDNLAARTVMVSKHLTCDGQTTSEYKNK